MSADDVGNLQRTAERLRLLNTLQIAIGVTNVLTPFFGGYSATGSFSRTAIKSKAGVRTPLAGWITAITVVIAIYGLTDAFYCESSLT